MSTYSLLIESNLHGNGRRLNEADVAAGSQAISEIHKGLQQIGLKERHGPDLDRVTSESLYVWQKLVSLSVEVLWFEGHGSILRGLRALPLEDIARMTSDDLDRFGGRIHAKLIVFGSCYTAASELWELLPRLVERTCVVVASETALKFTDGKLYPDLIKAWNQTRTSTPTVQAIALSMVAPKLLIAKVVEPENF